MMRNFKSTVSFLLTEQRDGWRSEHQRSLQTDQPVCLLMLTCLTVFKGSELEPAFQWNIKTEAQFEVF